MQPESMDPDDLIGAVVVHRRWRFFAGTVAEWILDYASYDPGFDPAKSDTVFRGNLLSVRDEDAEKFLAAMEPFQLDVSDLRRFVEEQGPSEWPLSVLINFDDRICVNGYPEIPIHEHLPPGWDGLEDVPSRYLPDDLRRIWEPI